MSSGGHQVRRVHQHWCRKKIQGCFDQVEKQSSEVELLVSTHVSPQWVLRRPYVGFHSYTSYNGVIVLSRSCILLYTYAHVPPTQPPTTHHNTYRPPARSPARNVLAITHAPPLPPSLSLSACHSKRDSSPVTVADFTVQAIVLGVLKRYFPDHGFIAEETSSVLRQDQPSLLHVLAVVGTVLGREGLTEAELCAAIDLGARGHGKHERGHWGKGGRTFVLDPIDGTKGFLRGEQFCVALVSLSEVQGESRGAQRGERIGLACRPLYCSVPRLSLGLF